MTTLTPELRTFLTSNGFFELREINGVVCGLCIYYATVGVVYELTESSPGRRYCFKEYTDAYASLQATTDPSVHASGPWIRCKGTYNGEIIDIANPNPVEG